MMLANEHRPLGNRQFANALLLLPGRVERDFKAAFTIGVSPRVDWIRQHMIDRDVAWVDPADGGAVMRL